MNRNEFINENQEVLATLNDFATITSNLPNIIVLGSVGLISHTQTIGYFRKIKDIDTIADSKYQDEIENHLINNGYKKSTFIDKKMPLSKILRLFSSSKYTRFYKKDSCDLEILFTPYVYQEELLRIELFPMLYATLPHNVLIENELMGIKVKTISSEALYAVKQLTHNSFGKLYKKGSEKRLLDHEALYKNINVHKYQDIIKAFEIKVGFLPIPIKHYITLRNHAN